MRTLRQVALLGALLLPLSACGARTELGDSAPAPGCPGGRGVRSCVESVAAFCAKVGCPLHAFSLDWGDPRWCTIGADEAADAQAENSGAHWFYVGITNNGVSAMLFYDYSSAALAFVLDPAETSCLAGEVPPAAQCQGLRLTGVGLCAP